MKNRYLSMAGILLTTSLLLTGCGGGSSGSYDARVDNGYQENAAIDAGSGFTNDFAAKSAGDMTSEDSLEPNDASAEEVTDDNNGEGTQDNPELNENIETQPSDVLNREKIVYTGNIHIEAKEYESALDELYKSIEAVDGIIQSENNYNSDYSDNYRSARSTNITVRIPSEKFRDFMKSTDGIGHVTDKTTNADNITKQYFDIASRQASLQAELDRLNQLMATATDTDDLIKIMDRISDVQGDLDSIKEQLRNMDVDVAYSTVTIMLDEVVEYAEVTESFGSRVKRAFAGSWKNFVSLIQGAIIALIYLLPLLLLLACAAAVLFVIVRFIIKQVEKRPKKKKKIPVSTITPPYVNDTGVNNAKSNAEQPQNMVNSQGNGNNTNVVSKSDNAQPTEED